MVELQAGHVLSLQSLKNGGLTYQGKPLEFECTNEDERVYTARATLTQEEINAGNNVEQEFTIQFPVGEGIVSVNPKLPTLLENKNKLFKDKTDAEKHTIINSLEYTTNRQTEPRQLADGSVATTTGVKANESSDKSKSQDVKQVQAGQGQTSVNKEDIKVQGNEKTDAGKKGTEETKKDESKSTETSGYKK